ncbi:hypothetical protein MIDIC_570003 [Alphaproteobacteria bacterium]
MLLRCKLGLLGAGLPEVLLVLDVVLRCYARCCICTVVVFEGAPYETDYGKALWDKMHHL